MKAGVIAIRKLGVKNGFDVDATEDSTWFNNQRLRNYKAIVFLSCSGKVFGPDEEKALQEFIHQGGGFVGIHAATTCEYDWPWYGRLIGAYYNGDASPQKARLLVVDKHHPSTKFLPDVWWKKDEWYNFKNINPDIHVLIKLMSIHTKVVKMVTIIPLPGSIHLKEAGFFIVPWEMQIQHSRMLFF